MEQNPANFREYAGALIAFIIVIAFVSIGFVQLAIVVFHGTSVPAPQDWMAAMLSLASAALGFLIGKQTTGQPAQQLVASPNVALQPAPPPSLPPTIAVEPVPPPPPFMQG